MLIEAGYNIAFECTSETPLMLMVHIRPERRADLNAPEKFTLWPDVPYRTYTDHFGNICTRVIAPVGRLSLWNRFVIADSGLPGIMPEGASQHSIDELPDDVLMFLLGSRYVRDPEIVDHRLVPIRRYPSRVGSASKAILEYTQSDRIRFGYEHARSDRTAWEAHEEGVGVCRDFAHLGIALCRCMNIPARYCTGYLGDIGVPPDPSPMDFSAWFEVYLAGAWYTMDARHKHPRIGRILRMAKGRARNRYRHQRGLRDRQSCRVHGDYE